MKAEIILVSSLLVLAACGPKGGTSGSATPAASPAPTPGIMKSAWGKIEPKSGSKVTGDVLFKADAEGKLTLSVKVEGAPAGEHAVHLHEKGDCSAADASSAGGHFNPYGHPHAAPAAEAKHSGDFGNLKVGADGKGSLELATPWLELEGGNGVVGRAFVVHEKVDDFKTQPTGNAGSRIGCAVIQLAQ